MTHFPLPDDLYQRIGGYARIERILYSLKICATINMDEIVFASASDAMMFKLAI